MMGGTETESRVGGGARLRAPCHLAEAPSRGHHPQPSPSAVAAGTGLSPSSQTRPVWSRRPGPPPLLHTCTSVPTRRTQLEG